MLYDLIHSKDLHPEIIKAIQEFADTEPYKELDFIYRISENGSGIIVPWCFTKKAVRYLDKWVSLEKDAKTKTVTVKVVETWYKRIVFTLNAGNSTDEGTEKPDELKNKKIKKNPKPD